MTNEAIKKFKKYLCEEIMDRYHISEIEAYNAVKKSYLSKILKRDPDFVDHDTLEEWATLVFEEWKENKMKRQKLLMM